MPHEVTDHSEDTAEEGPVGPPVFREVFIEVGGQANDSSRRITDVLATLQLSAHADLGTVTAQIARFGFVPDAILQIHVGPGPTDMLHWACVVDCRPEALDDIVQATAQHAAEAVCLAVAKAFVRSVEVTSP